MLSTLWLLDIMNGIVEALLLEIPSRSLSCFACCTFFCSPASQSGSNELQAGQADHSRHFLCIQVPYVTDADHAEPRPGRYKELALDHRSGSIDVSVLFD